MIVGLVLLILGVALIWNNLILGLIPGLILIVIGIVAIVVGGLWRGGLAVLRAGSANGGSTTGPGGPTKVCPACHNAVASSAAFCPTCGHQFQ